MIIILIIASAAGVYHVCVMPCFDKKLEASRDDFAVEVDNNNNNNNNNNNKK